MKNSAVTGFGYRKMPVRFVMHYKKGKWRPGRMVKNDKVTISESAGVIQYAQTVFEGLKAYRTADGRIVCFRPDLNAQRLRDSCIRLSIPPIEQDVFLDAVARVVRANEPFIPAYGTGGALYLRPCVFATGPVLGVHPADAYEFRVFASPVGAYFSGRARLRISQLDRAAPRGTGNIKAGLNYAMSLYNIADAHEKGYQENLYLDSATHTFIEETGGANVLFVTKDRRLVTPLSDTILPSITRRSLVEVAERVLGLEVEQRRIRVEELADFVECGLAGTAAVISPVAEIDTGSQVITYPPVPESILESLHDILVEMQTGRRAAPEGWLWEIREKKEQK
ncbi:MAG: branched-chain amino acid aminotransferase [Eubacteriales bacterium]|nr:branched-chain amino acid aminotransferase [Eubacteriales bacterium]